MNQLELSALPTGCCGCTHDLIDCRLALSKYLDLCNSGSDKFMSFLVVIDKCAFPNRK